MQLHKRMEDIPAVFDEMRAGKIDGRIVLEIGQQSPRELSLAATKAA